MSKPTTDTVPCIIPNCGKPKKWNGLCQSCYGQAKRIMESDGLDWWDLVTMGLAEMQEKPFLAAYKAKRAEKNKPKLEELAVRLDNDGGNPLTETEK